MRRAVLACAVAACAEDGATTVAPIFPLDFASSYVEVRGCRGSSDHAPGRIRVSVSPAAASAYTAGTYPFAVGTTIVKTITDDSTDDTCAGAVLRYAAMRKIGEGSTAADWDWQETDAAGNVLTDGASGRCQKCHTACTNGRDMTCTDP